MGRSQSRFPMAQPFLHAGQGFSVCMACEASVVPSTRDREGRNDGEVLQQR